MSGIDTYVYDHHAMLIERLRQVGSALDTDTLEKMGDTLARWRMTHQWNPRGAENPFPVTDGQINAHQAVIAAATAFHDACADLAGYGSTAPILAPAR